MKRKIISIDEKKCTGCGQCIPDCPEGALRMIDGKARLVSDLFCDGLGACIGTCPEGAISVVEREAVPYDEKTVMENIAKQGASVIRAHLEHLAGHGQTAFYNQAIEYLIENDIPNPGPCGPGTQGCARTSRQGASHSRQDRGRCLPSRTARPASLRGLSRLDGAEHPAGRLPWRPRQPVGGTTASELRQWPVQLALLNPAAPYFDNADLLISADCVPFAYPGFHAEFLRGRILIIFCPKLDPDIDGYIEKLAEIFTQHHDQVHHWSSTWKYPAAAA